MFKVIASDQKEYGPVSVDQVKQWIIEKRLDAQSPVQIEGTTGWTTLGALPEFAETLASAGPARTVPPLPTAASAAPAAPTRTSRAAIASLVLGILALPTCGLTALFGLIFGIVGLVKINKNRSQLSGSGLAIGGLCLSGVFLLILPIMAAMLLPALSKAKGKAQNIQCLNNVKQLNLALLMYVEDNDGKLPPLDTWCDAVKPYTGDNSKVFVCTSTPGAPCSYAVNKNLEGKSLRDVSDPGRTVMVFESTAGWNKAGGPELAAPNHDRTHLCVGFVDGHAEVMDISRLGSLRWNP